MIQPWHSERSPVARIPRVAVESGGRGVAGQTHVRRWPRTTRCNELAVIVIRDSELVGRESLIAVVIRTNPMDKWQTVRGDEWWCDSATASCAAGRFLIDTFGKDASAAWAKTLLEDALRSQLVHVDVTLTDENRRLIQALIDRGELVANEMDLGDRWSVARITDVLAGRSQDR